MPFAFVDLEVFEIVLFVLIIALNRTLEHDTSLHYVWCDLTGISNS